MKPLARYAMVAIAAAALAGAATAQAQTDEGGAPRIVATTGAALVENGVTVFRGSAVEVPAADPLAVTGAEAATGRNLWLIDRENGRLTGCHFRGTTRAGENRRIRCVTRSLPM